MTLTWRRQEYRNLFGVEVSQDCRVPVPRNKSVKSVRNPFLMQNRLVYKWKGRVGIEQCSKDLASGPIFPVGEELCRKIASVLLGGRRVTVELGS